MTLYSDRPAMMAIGDSLYQGVRSLSITAELARWSPPAQVAAMLGVPFATPDAPVPVLFDLEALFRGGGVIHVLSRVRDAAAANLDFWLGGQPWSSHEAFDNVAVGGATTASLTSDTFDEYWPEVQRLAARLRSNPFPDPGTIGQLWFALNTCYTLNPRRRPEQGGKTQLDQVADRRPETLLVNIGSNEGLFRACFAGALDQRTFESVRAIPGKLEELADRLADLPPQVERIVFNLLVRPRTAPNLTSREEFPPPTGPGYFPFYVPRLGDLRRDIPGDRVRAFDQLVLEVNEEVRALMEARIGARCRIVDLYAASDRFDGKHYPTGSSRRRRMGER